MRHAHSRIRSEIRKVAVDTIATATLMIETEGAGFTELTREARAFLDDINAEDGALLVFVRHTSASLVIQENADPDVQTDLLTALQRLAPEDAGWVHDTEGPDDMPAHIKAMLTSVSLHIPVVAGAAARHLAGALPNRASGATAQAGDRATVLRSLRCLSAAGAYEPSP